MGIVCFLNCIQATITLSNIVYTQKCDFNLISSSQLQKSGIIYYDHIKRIILKQKQSTVKSSSQNRKPFFTLNIKSLEKVLII